MSSYIRPRIPGASVFFTVRLSPCAGGSLVGHIDHLRSAVRLTHADHPFDIAAWVVLPDHIHAVWTLPVGDCDYSKRWSVIKARFSRQVTAVRRRPSHILRRERGIWQRRFWEHHLRTESDKADAIRYCLTNPVKHGLVTDPRDWPYSSIHRDIKNGRWAA
ncbi:transposase [uncultured Tateyamaria sp.]|uniref:REP-associated tyrosine transposase n=1 Tax=uncultured Tateyamaria sp. TaxID=455651 RepID=UPI00263148D3|nr:transposase [uncultured Tateyamaria sp.]